MKQSLFHIEKEYIELAEQIIEAEGLIDDELSEKLRINQASLEKKAINYAFLIKSLDNRSKNIKDEMDRLSKMKKTTDKTIEQLKESIGGAMKLYEVEKIEGDLIKLSFRKSTKVVQTLSDFDPNELPDNLKTVVTTVKPNLKEIGEVLKMGETVEGFERRDYKNLQIK